MAATWAEVQHLLDRMRVTTVCRLLGQVECTAPEGHDYYVALDRPCDHCGAAL